MVQFPLVKGEICKVFYDVMLYRLHEVFNDGLSRMLRFSGFAIECSCTAPLTLDAPNFNDVCSRVRLL